ncbi:DNA replication complex GINS protein PSF1 [Umbelopsis sp. PMI_123]|nr:DNA replication complex GINS protein PSF1 [Umbelopsis sp. PMI_123]
MSTFGDSAYKLAKEAKRTMEILAPYNEDLVRSICREIRFLCSLIDKIKADMKTDLQQNPSAITTVLVHHLTVKRSKRVLMAYHRQRVNRIKQITWDQGNVLSSDNRIALSGPEIDFAKEYTELITSYKQNFMEIDLGGNGGIGLDPPDDLFIEVRVLKDAGEVQTEYGVLNLKRGSQFYVRRTDVESLIRSGYLKHV